MIDNSKWIKTKQYLDAWKSVLIERRGARDQLRKVKEAEENKLVAIQETQRVSHLAQLFLLSEIVDRRKSVIESIQEIGTHALRMIYSEDYQLIFNTFEEKRKEGLPNFKMEINIASNQEGEQIQTGIDDQRGGGLVEIIAFSLRIAALNWLNYEGPLILDESYKSMSKDEKIHDVARFMRELSEITGRQIIFATHAAEVFAPISDQIIKILSVDGVATHTIIDKSMIDLE